MDNMQFASCMERMRQGDREALKAIYDAYAPYLYHLILGIVLSKEDAEDLTSECFLKIWQMAGRFDSEKSHKAWICVMARNLAFDFLRRRRREIPSGDSQELSLERPEFQDEGGYEEVLSNISIEDALSRLSASEREIVHLKVVGELTFREISDILNVPMGTVTWRYRQAVGKLRRCGYEA
ncbi:MAG: RNA polymerase sigma factor [Blautia sp.]|nr:RNA polymerase sigma factor [Blautia sp.]